MQQVRWDNNNNIFVKGGSLGSELQERNAEHVPRSGVQVEQRRTLRSVMKCIEVSSLNNFRFETMKNAKTSSPIR